MKSRWIAGFLLGAVLLSACSGVEMLPAPVTQAPPAAANPATDTPVPTMEETTMPPVKNPVPPRGQPTGSGNQPPAPTRPTDPQPDDEKMTRQPAFVDSAQVSLEESNPPRIVLSISGNLPTPCHRLRIRANEPDKQNRINVAVYSVTQPDAVCTQVIRPFESGIQLGPYPAGKYTLLVNGEEVGEVQVP